ncbi:MAG TPA: cyclodeaminase/cyclohydrolase family protein [Streptosporangiaceae bacterium]|nr:cyclodeaminase/cyclohydrolase family protein [Streptosporangiaceae bacterium]
MAAYLDELADRRPVPGGGAAAALHVAQGAALLCMVGRYSDGARQEAEAEAIRESVLAGEGLRRTALRLADEDAEAFSRVAVAYAAPKETEAEREARRTAIASTLASATRPAADLVCVAGEVVRLAQRLAGAANKNLAADLAAAVEATRAGGATARINILANLSGISDPALIAEFREAADAAAGIVTAAERVSETIVRQITEAPPGQRR